MGNYKKRYTTITLPNKVKKVNTSEITAALILVAIPIVLTVFEKW